MPFCHLDPLKHGCSPLQGVAFAFIMCSDSITDSYAELINIYEQTIDLQGWVLSCRPVTAEVTVVTATVGFRSLKSLRWSLPHK